MCNKQRAAANDAADGEQLKEKNRVERSCAVAAREEVLLPEAIGRDERRCASRALLMTTCSRACCNRGGMATTVFCGHSTSNNAATGFDLLKHSFESSFTNKTTTNSGGAVPW
jgi:hypothetical protein